MIVSAEERHVFEVEASGGSVHEEVGGVASVVYAEHDPPAGLA